jgi:DNA-binding response OmpR family regulator
VARVVALATDLFFGSKIEGTLGAAGHEVKVISDVENALAAAGDADVVIADLDAPGLDPSRLVARLSGTPLLGFYSHVDVKTKSRAEAAGFDLVVPRSRMAREMAELVERLTRGGQVPPATP